MAISSGEFNPGIALKAGADFSQNVFTAERKARQYNALRQMFGDAVGPDDNLAQLSANRRADQLQPGKLEEQSLSNAALRESNAFNAMNNPIKLQQNQATLDSTNLTNDYSRRTMDSRVMQQNQAVRRGEQTIAQGAQTLRKGETELSDAQAERERTAAQGILSAVKQRIANGEDAATAFDAVAPQVAAMEGVDPGRLRALRDAFVKNPSGTIQAMEDYIGAARPNTALIQAEAARRRSEAAQTAADAKAKGKVADTGARSFTDFSKRDVPDLIAGLRKDMDEAGDPGPLGRSALSFAQRSGVNVNDAQYQMRSRIETLKNRLGTHNLQAFRAQGLTFGQITEKEFERVAAAVQNLDPNQSPERLRENLDKIERMYTDWLAKVEAENPQLNAKPSDGDASARADKLVDEQAARRKALLDKYR